MDLSSYRLDDEVKDFLKTQKDFTIDRISQEGGNCDIFFGYHNIFERRIALKIYYGNDLNKSHSEPRVLSKIEHPNILRVRDAKRIGDYYSYFMTDEISGGDLEKCYKNEELDLKQKLNIIHGVLNGLTELHKDEIAIVHRDIKPKNILLDKATMQPLISDFGSIKHFDKEIGSVSSSKTTLVYTPKEVFENNLYTKQSDIYQVGVTMFQILGGFFPDNYSDWLTEKEKTKYTLVSGDFDKSVFIDKVIHRLVLRNKFLRTDTLPIYIDPKIKKIIQRASHPNLKMRYSITGEFMSDLYKILNSLTNWQNIGEELIAIKSNGDKFRVVNSKNGYSIEKLGSLGWRRTGGYSNTSNALYLSINKK